LTIENFLSSGKQFVDEGLNRLLPKEGTYPESIHQSMRYSVLAGGKRLRPLLVIAAAEAVGGSRESVLPFAVAAELIHTYTLIHDDLPALDDDNLRRGKPTNHKVFGEAIAILAGDALLTHAFSIMTNAALMGSIPEKNVLKASNEMAKAMGSMGVIGGQVVDIESEGSPVNAETLEYIHIYKTGFLFRACIQCGAVLSQATPAQFNSLSRYGAHIGLAFQIVDDILDITSENEVLGKDVGSDLEKGKATYPALFGLEESKKKAALLVDEAVASLDDFDERAEPLRGIARFFVERTF
jgi:geranylgeranyl diphosphate synthase type II